MTPAPPAGRSTRTARTDAANLTRRDTPTAAADHGSAIRQAERSAART